MHRLVTQGHLSEVQLSSAHLSMVLHDDVEEALHLLLRGVDYQVLALGHVELEQELSLDALDFGHMLNLIAELTDVNLLDRD